MPLSSDSSNHVPTRIGALEADRTSETKRPLGIIEASATSSVVRALKSFEDQTERTGTGQTLRQLHSVYSFENKMSFPRDRVEILANETVSILAEYVQDVAHYSSRMMRWTNAHGPSNLKLFTVDPTEALSHIGAIVRLSQDATFQLRSLVPYADSASFESRSDSKVMAVLQRIQELSMLENNWDGEDAAPLTPVAAAHAYRMVAISASLGVELIQASIDAAPLSDGGLILEWDTDVRRSQWWIHGDGTVSGISIAVEDGKAVDWQEVPNPDESGFREDMMLLVQRTGRA